MRGRRTAYAVIFLVAGLATAGVFYVSQPGVEIVRARSDIAPLTQITADMVGTVRVAPADAPADATPSGTYAPDVPIAIAWDTPLPGQGTYSVQLVLDLRTTYADGTVRTETVAGSVAVTVIYSAVGP